MLRTARRFLGDGPAAEDCLQDATIRVLDGIAGFEGRARLSTWVHRIVVTTALSHLRKHKRDGVLVSLDTLLPAFDDEGRRPPDPALSIPDRTLSEAATATWVKDAVSRLPDDHRNVFVLRDVEGYSSAETAAVLEISEEAVRVRLHRARAALRTLLTRTVSGEEEDTS